MVSLRPFKVEDAEVLATISRRAFDHDIVVGAASEGGPPGYESAEWQTQTACDADSYFVIEADSEVVGGLIVFGTLGDYWLGRMFVDPDRQDQGLGSAALVRLEEAYPDWTRWRLETPSWNKRTQRFYEKAGYTHVGTSPSGDLLYEKHSKEAI
jgi:GNAT superfamily N-acetyltransferase